MLMKHFLLVFFLITFSLPTYSATTPLTSVTDNPSNKHYSGKFIWHDLLTPNRAKTKQFYGQLLGWTFKDEGDYSIIFNQGKKIGGILTVKHQTKQQAQAIWLVSMSIDNMSHAINAVQANGGQVLNGPMDMAQRGQGVLVSDPLGAHLVLLKAKDGDPITDDSRVGDWLWNEIWTHEPDKTLPFYRQLASYTSTLHSDGYYILKSQDKWRAGVRHTFSKAQVTGETKEAYNETNQVRWVSTIRVADPKALLTKVEALGGQIVLRPGEAPSDDNTALIIDNTGALLMLQRWEPQTNEGAQSL